jgi:hypothetical protein
MADVCDDDGKKAGAQRSGLLYFYTISKHPKKLTGAII